MVALTCPACGAEVPDAAPVCPKCRLSESLFQSVREAAGAEETVSPASLRTIGELLSSVDLDAPAEPPATTEALLARPLRFPAMPPTPSSIAPLEAPTAPAPIGAFPELPLATTEAELDARYDEYRHVGRRLGLDFGDFESRGAAARLVRDTPSLATVVREMFVHLTSALTEEYDAALAQRNELAAFSPVGAVDAALDAARRALVRRDVTGAQRRLALVRDELHQSEEEWAVGRILVTEGELLAATVRELGGDPGPALGPFESGRRLIQSGRRSEGERLLARGAIALWTVLEPRLIAELYRLRDRLLEIRSAGGEIQGPVEELRTGLAELRQRNFVGTVVSYRRVRAFVDQQAVPDGREPELSEPVRPSPLR